MRWHDVSKMSRLTTPPKLSAVVLDAAFGAWLRARGIQFVHDATLFLGRRVDFAFPSRRLRLDVQVVHVVGYGASALGKRLGASTLEMADAPVVQEESDVAIAFFLTILRAAGSVNLGGEQQWLRPASGQTPSGTGGQRALMMARLKMGHLNSRDQAHGLRGRIIHTRSFADKYAGGRCRRAGDMAPSLTGGGARRRGRIIVWDSSLLRGGPK